MTHRARWISAFVVVAAAVAIGWTMQRGTESVPRRTLAASNAQDAAPLDTPAAAVEHKAAQRPAKAAPSMGAAHALPGPLTPLGEAVQTLRDYAEGGDTDAAIELSWRLGSCTEHELKAIERLEQSDRQMIEDEKSDERFTPEQRAVRIENGQERIDQYVRQREACRALPADVRAGWLEWIDRAAQSGNTAAMRGYARVIASQYTNANDVRADLDTAIERRDKSRAYLDEALRRGDAEALRDIANAYRDSAGPTIYPMDSAKAYAYAYAGTLAGISRGNDLDRTMEEVAGSLDGQQLADAQAAGRRIYEKCCAVH